MNSTINRLALVLQGQAKMLGNFDFDINYLQQLFNNFNTEIVLQSENDNITDIIMKNKDIFNKIGKIAMDEKFPYTCKICGSRNNNDEFTCIKCDEYKCTLFEYNTRDIDPILRKFMWNK